jgi:hypothetical protein
MPSAGYASQWTKADEKKWLRCRQETMRGMIAEGWKTYANKFDRVFQKRCVKLWNAA